MKFTNRTIVKTRTLSSDAKTLWSRWSTHEGLKTFLGRDNKIELHPGGAFEIYFLMDNPYGARGSEGCRVLAYIPEKMIAFSWNAPPYMPFIRSHEHKTAVAVLFEEAGPDMTRLTLSHHGWPEGKEWDEAFTYFDSAWDQVLNGLEKSLA
ncbi:MAG: SRPBCC domain-containing protein [Bacteroidota bacterium]